MLSAKAIRTSLAVQTSDLPNLSWIQLSAEAAGWAPRSSPPSTKAPRNRLHIPSLAHFLFVLHIYFLLPFSAHVLESMISRGAVSKTFIAALAWRTFCGRDNANPAQEDVVSAACSELVFAAGEKLTGMMIRV